MAVYWQCHVPGDGDLTLDLLTVTLPQVRNAVGRCNPRLPPDDLESLAQNVFSHALQLRGLVSLLGAAGGALEDIGNSIGVQLVGSVGDALQAVQETILNNQQVVRVSLATQLAAQEEAQTDLITQVKNGIGGFLDSAGSTVNTIASNVGSAAQSAINTASSTINSVVNTAKTSVQNVVNAASSAVQGVVNSAKVAVAGAIRDAGDFIGDVITNVAGGVSDFLSDAGSFLGGLYGNVKNAVGRIVDDLAAGVSALADKLLGLPGALLALGSDITDALSGVGSGIIGGVGDFLLGPFSDVLTAFSKDKENAMADVIGETVTRALANPQLPTEYRPLIKSFREPSHPIWMILLVFALPIVGAQVIGTVLNPILQPAVQFENAKIRPTIPSLPEAIGMFYRDVIDRNTLVDIGSKWGFTDRDIDRSVSLAQSQPAPIDLIDWRNRELISDGAMRDRLSKLGYSDPDIAAMDKAAEVIPPLSDLVRFAVREAFPGQVAFDGVRGSGVPARFVEQASKLGLPPEGAKSYWAAHWELPSVSAAFSMYHRGYISEGQLRALLKEQDFAPEWVDNLIRVAFDPLTRVDVRRMFELGVLNKAEVNRAYRDLGYSPENAARLADFVEADAAASTAGGGVSERDLTRGDLVGAYADGIITRAEAESALRQIGYDANETGLILDREDLRQIRAERKETRSAIVDQAVAGVIDFNGAEDKLLSSGYTTDETKAALREIQRKINAQARQPSKADLVAFRKRRLITDEEYADELRRLGYAEKWVELFVKLPAGSTPDA